MDTSKTITKKQHFVPKFYLKRFAKEDNFVEVLDLDKKKIIKPYPHSGVCYKNFFYGIETGKEDEVSQEAEKALKLLEDSIAPRIDSIEKNIINGKKLDDNEREILASLMSMMYIRGLYMRKQIQKMENELAKKVMKMHSHQKNFTDYMKKVMREQFGENLSEEQADKMRDIFQKEKFDLVANNVGHLSFFSEMNKFANVFFDKKWRFYYSNKKDIFITSDTPLIEWFPQEKRFYGYTILERKHYLSLSPRLLIELINPFEPGKHVKRKMVEEKDADYYNFIIAEHSDSFCYAKEIAPLQNLIDIREKILEKNRISLPSYLR